MILLYFTSVFMLTTEFAVIVTGRPQLQLGGGGIWLGKASDDGMTAKDASQLSESTGGLKLITENEKPEFTGIIQLQVFISKGDISDLIKIHESNSSFSIPSQEVRKGLCPKGNFMYAKDNKCYLAGVVTPGIDSPCADDFMGFVENPDTPGYGQCNCVRFKGSTTRPVVFWEVNNRCYWLYDKGPCEKGKWLVYRNGTDGSKKLECVKRTCPENTVEDTNTNFPKFWFKYKGKCYKTETKNKEFCGNEVDGIYFANDKPEPVCLERRPLTVAGVKGLASGVNILQCRAGQKLLPSGECKRIASFE